MSGCHSRGPFYVGRPCRERQPIKDSSRRRIGVSNCIRMCDPTPKPELILFRTTSERLRDLSSIPSSAILRTNKKLLNIYIPLAHHQEGPGHTFVIRCVNE